MNEFTAKKLGEVLAFVDVDLEVLNKGKEALQSELGNEKIENSIKSLMSQKDLIHTLSDRAGVLKTVLEKMEQTGDKLRKMRDIYLADKWDNPIELLEWMGFFEGAAVVHASLLQGAAEEMSHSELKSVADQSLIFHKELLEEAVMHLHLDGRKKAGS